MIILCLYRIGNACIHYINMLFTVYYLTMYNCVNYAPYFTSLLSLAVCIHYIILSPFLLDSWFQLISITKKILEKNTCLVVNSYIIHSFIISFFIHFVLKSENCVYGHIKASKRSMTISVKSYLRFYSNSLRLLFYYYISPLNKKVKSFKMTQPILKCLLFIVTSYKNPSYYINLSSSLVNSYAIFQSNIINLKKYYSQMEYWVEDCLTRVVTRLPQQVRVHHRPHHLGWELFSTLLTRTTSTTTAR